MKVREEEGAGGSKLDRRQLLGGAGALAAGAGIGGASIAAALGSPANAATPEGALAPPAPFELDELSIHDLQEGMKSGRWTSRRLVELYLERIAAVDRPSSGLGTNSMLELNPDALAIADALDAERRAGKPRGPLHGVPVVVKDNLDTGDRMRTSAGSLALAESIAAKDSFVVARLRAAGAVLLGKTNLSEWANFRSTKSTSGWSGRGGQVRNPYALDRNPCGSSSGTGAGISAGVAAAGIGTETDGSITCPSSMCGLVGLKPTVGLVSRTGIIPISATQDTAGPMCRSVADAAIVLTAIVGTDLLDPATAASAGRSTDYVAALAGGLAGARLGVARNFFGWHREIDRQMVEILELLKSLGATLVDPAEIPKAKEIDATEYEAMLYEFKQGLNSYLGALPSRPDQPRTLTELIAWNERHAAAEMPWFGQEIFLKAEEKGPLTDKAYLDALATNQRLSRAEGLDAVLTANRLDALVCPTMGPAYFIDWLNGDHYGGSATTPSAVSGYPHLTVPAGDVHGLPWGLSFLGPAWSEAKLLAYGAAFEKARAARRAPRFAATAALAV